MTLYAASQYAAGIAVIHAFWLFFYLAGTIVWCPRLSGPPWHARGASGALLDVVVATATGMGIVAFISFGLGLAGGLYPIAVPAVAVVLLAVAHALGDSPLRRAFWSVRFNSFVAAWTPWTLGLYALTLVLAIPAILPESTFDALFFHLVYAVDWARAHAIYVDQWVRFPYYAQNWILLDTWMFELGFGSSIGFLGWFALAFSILGTYAFVEAAAGIVSNAGTRTVRIGAVLSALAVANAPVLVRWGDTGMVDVPIGFIFLTCVAATVMAVATRERRWLLSTIVLFGFFCGMKGSFLAFIPIGIAATWIGARTTGLTVRRALGACAIVLALSVPWYVKNFIQTGDPIAPYLHLALHQPDSKWTAADMQGVIADLRVDQSPGFLLKMPIDILVHPETLQYREPGVSILLAFLFLPGVVLVYALRRARSQLHSRETETWLIFSAVLFYAVMYWILTAHLGRYASLFYATLAAFMGCVVLCFARITLLRKATAFTALAVSALPAPVGQPWLEHFWYLNIVQIATVMPDRETFLATHIPAYREEEALSLSLERGRVTDPRVYVFGDAEQTLAFYFKLHGVTKIGDWFGPERWSDFAAAIDRGDAPAWLATLHINGVIVGTHVLATPERISKLRAQLAHAGYREDHFAGNPDTIFFGPGTAP